ncbi:hypothetical protein EDC19_0692 [Natranaerovirga hydrolytica]|uniref:Uncharacterized protein n=1 Tax=Natranaerovirga hydrolytica TaxID=680378 RepID=A0A4R1N0A0_9FIRM|nr:hypothetical protein [Natranaerovirga hydrolytica]TCK98272.1 hypothetical protein EDC19_0692 [Natranaerovirga hydrolytica]
MKAIKASYGYLKKRKKSYLLSIVLGMILSIALFMIGFLIFETQGNVLTVISILILFPVSLWVVRLIIFMRYKSITREDYETVEKLLETNKKSEVIADLILTNNTGIQFIPVGIVNENSIIVYTYTMKNNQNEQEGIKKVTDYLSTVFEHKGIKVNITVYSDFEAFVDKVNRNKEKPLSKTHEKVIKQLLIHSM